MNTQNAPDEPVDSLSNEHDEAFTQDDVARAAKQIWEDEGRPEGKAEEHWRQAEYHLRMGLAKSPALQTI